MLPKCFSKEYNSVALAENTVIVGEYRFTVLTDSLLRIEYDKSKTFEDRATQSVINRQTKRVEFSLEDNNGVVTVKTENLTLEYVKSLGLSRDGLTVSLNNIEGAVWHYGDNPETLKGTYRTLDGIFVERSVELGDGVCSRGGYAILDDSKSLAILPDGWLKPRNDDIVDIYFFGYGYDYISATKALYMLTGNPPLLPNYVFGNWWSRFKAYSEESYKELMLRFKEEDIPFAVSVVDMDWHLFGGNMKWWSGYTWNEELFPDYKRFLNWLHDNGLHTALNLHPAGGVKEHEAMYRKMAEAMGIDPESKQTVEFEASNKEMWKPYFEILHHPYEKDGVDFWWMDWQQGTESGMKGLDPLWILNYYHTLDAETREKRPMYFSRYSGPGSQRFYIGFSGDAYINWDAYQFEPYFTATSANIAYPYWSHDIGGFQHGVRDDELYARWVQFGVFSPILRIHSTNYDFVCKEPWNYGAEAEKTVGNALRLRHKLFPYLYTLNYRAHTDNTALCQPLYYLYPEEENAYKYKNEYFFGSELLVVPVTKKTDPKTKLAITDLWLPEGKWIDATNGLVYEGNREITVYNNIQSMPVFAKSGAIVPMNKHIKGDNTVGSKKDMEIYVYAGASNSFVMYEDEGDNNRYKDGHFTKTEMVLDYNKNSGSFTVNAADGDISVLPETRNYTIFFRGFSKETNIDVLGKKFNSFYEDKTNTLEINIENVEVTEALNIVFNCENGLICNNENWKSICFDIMLQAETNSLDKLRIYKEITNDVIAFEKRVEILEKFKDIDENLIPPIMNLLRLSENNR